jgi:hypothetical protein
VLRPERREPCRRRVEVPAHDHDPAAGQRARVRDLEECEVRERADRDERRAALGVRRDQVERRAGAGGAGRRYDVPGARPGARLVALERRERAAGAGGDGDRVTPREREVVRGHPGAHASGVQVRRQAHELDVVEPEQHRQGARVVDVAADVGVEVDQHRIRS